MLSTGIRKLAAQFEVIVDGMDFALSAKRRRLMKPKAEHMFHHTLHGGASRRRYSSISFTSASVGRKLPIRRYDDILRRVGKDSAGVHYHEYAKQRTSPLRTHTTSNRLPTRRAHGQCFPARETDQNKISPRPCSGLARRTSLRRKLASICTLAQPRRLYNC